MTTYVEAQPSGGSRRSIPAEPAMLRALRIFLAIFVGIAAFFVNTALSLSAEEPALAIVKPGEMRAGSLLLRRDGDGYADATRLGIDVDLTVSGPTIRARVTQIFRNPTQDWVEAIYVYP